MRVLLINPPAADGVRQVREGRCMQRAGAWTAVWTPISLATCAAVLRRDGHQVRLRDCIVEDLDFKALAHIIGAFRPELVVFNAVTPALVSDLGTARWVKAVCPQARCAAIGIHGTALPAETLELEPALDAVVRGEPELTVADLASGRDYSAIAGISWRTDTQPGAAVPHGEIRHNPDRPFVAPLDDLPCPAWDLIRTELYRMPFSGERFLLVGTGRGCPYPCTFCADRTYYGCRLRLRSAGSVADEIERNTRDFGVRDFLFWSESFTLSRRFATELAEEMIRRRLDVRWVCNSRVDHVDRELLERFRRAGCWMIGYGIESGVQRILDGVRKGTTLAQSRDAVQAARAAGLQVTGHCVLGFPGEGRADIIATIRFALDIGLDFAQFYCAVPFPGSPLYDEARAAGWIQSDDWSRFEQNFSVLNTPQLRAEEIMELRRAAYRRFYLRPKLMARTLKQTHSLQQLGRLAGSVKDFLTWV
jgi:radical SAM superfamily enzyme YgiQ (UPF0313 family)